MHGFWTFWKVPWMLGALGREPQLERMVQGTDKAVATADVHMCKHPNGHGILQRLWA